jgi:hypothetical protein
MPRAAAGYAVGRQPVDGRLLVAPTLFLGLHDRAQAGQIVSMLFFKEAWLALACGLAMLCWLGATPRWKRSGAAPSAGLAVAMLLCAGVFWDCSR